MPDAHGPRAGRRTGGRRTDDHGSLRRPGRSCREGRGTGILELSRTALPEVIDAIEGADAVVFGSPLHRATYSALLKGTLEGTARGTWGETRAPLQGKPAAIVLTGASGHHFLAVNDLRDVLAGFFAVQVLAPGLHLDHSGHLDRSTLTDDSAALAAGHGSALLDLAVAVRPSPALAALRPQV
jgi:FMN reductase